MTRTGKEYAVALYDLALENKTESLIYDELMLVRQVFDTADGLAELLGSPAVSKSSRLSLIDDTFTPCVSEYVVSFLCILCEHGEIALLNSCIDEFDEIYRREMHIISASVTSAVELTDNEKEKLGAALEKKLSSRLEITYSVDPTLLGGLKVEAGDLRLDGSLAGRIRSIKEEALDR